MKRLVAAPGPKSAVRGGERGHVPALGFGHLRLPGAFPLLDGLPVAGEGALCLFIQPGGDALLFRPGRGKGEEAGDGLAALAGAAARVHAGIVIDRAVESAPGGEERGAIAAMEDRGILKVEVAAATLAAVLVGYNVILGTTPDGEPIRLLNESVLNGTILMILVTCTMASFSAQKGAHNIAMEESTDVEELDRNEVEILIPVSNQANVEELVNLGLSLKPKRAKNGLHALTVVDDKGSDGTSAKRSKRLLQLAVETAAADHIAAHIVQRIIVEDAQQFPQQFIREDGVVLRQNALQLLALLLHQFHGVVHHFAQTVQRIALDAGQPLLRDVGGQID